MIGATDGIKLCKRGHKMTRVGRGDKKHWVCNACRRLASARRGSSGGRRMAARVIWSPGYVIPFEGEPFPVEDDSQ